MANYEEQYSTTSVNTGGREGKSYLEDGTYEVNITPAGSSRDGANPEELFALGYSACFHSALDAVKGQENVDADSIVRHKVTYMHDPDDNLDIKLKVDINVGIDGVEDSEAQGLIDRAHQVCPYSRMIENGHVDVTVNAVPYEE